MHVWICFYLLNIFQKTLICIGTDDGQLEIHSIIEKKLLIQEHSHKARLKCMTSFCKTVKKKKIVKNNDYLVTADSKGLIKLWCIKVFYNFKFINDNLIFNIL